MRSCRRWLAVMLAVLRVIAGGITADAEKTETGLEAFPVYHGSRESRKIALTVDDCNERDIVWKMVDLCEQYGIRMTFFPNANGVLTNGMGKGDVLREEDREDWQRLLDVGCEIGSHGYQHIKYNEKGRIIYGLAYFQDALDRMLGYHYQFRWFRPPYGLEAIKNENGSMRDSMNVIKRCGYDHVLLWDVSYMLDAEGALNLTQNGSILLFHAREKDYECLEGLIPLLLDAGYEPVTVSELFGFDPPETSEELFVYDPRTYKYPDQRDN